MFYKQVKELLIQVAKAMRWRVILIFSIVIAPGLSDVSCARPMDPTDARDCVVIDIDSGASHIFWRRSIAGVARAHGNYGVADYVMLRVPQEFDRQYHGAVVRIDVNADVRPISGVDCSPYAAIGESGVACGASVAGTGLAVTVNLKPMSLAKAQAISKAVVALVVKPAVATGAQCK